MTDTLKVLAIDDDLDDLKLIKNYLENSKRVTFIVEECSNFEDARKLLLNNIYHIVITDYKIPGDISGLEFIKEAKTLYARMAFILITSHGDTKLQREAINFGVGEYLEKGTFNAVLLEKACIYAFGLSQQTSEPNVPNLIQELVQLTRKTSDAQYKTANELASMNAEMKELRTDVNRDTTRIQDQINMLHTQAYEEIKSIRADTVFFKIKDITEYVSKNTQLIYILAILIVIMILTLNYLPVENLKAIMEIFK
jgi:DNA-binding NtrC family response regulator